MSSDPVSSSSSSGPESEDASAEVVLEVVASQEEPASQNPASIESQNVEVPGETELEVIPSSQVDPELQEDLKEEADAIVEALSNPNSSLSDTVSKSFSSTPGYLSNRWNTVNSSFSTPSSSQVPAVTTPPV